MERGDEAASGVWIAGRGDIEAEQPAQALALDRAVVGALTKWADHPRRDGDAAGDDQRPTAEDGERGQDIRDGFEEWIYGGSPFHGWGGRTSSGSTGTPEATISKWRCGPVVSPVRPTRPMAWPATTESPARTSSSGCRWP